MGKRNQSTTVAKKEEVKSVDKSTVVSQSYNGTMVMVGDDGYVTVKFRPLAKPNPSKSTVGNFVFHNASQRIDIGGVQVTLAINLYQNNSPKKAK